MRSDLGFSIADLGITSISEKIARDLSSHSKLADSLKSALSSQAGLEWAKLAAESPFNKLSKEFADSLSGNSISKALANMNGPLEALRAQAALDRSITAKFEALSASSLRLDWLKTIQDQHADLLASISEWRSSIDQIGKQLAGSVSNLDRFAAVAKPFAGVEWGSSARGSLSDVAKALANGPDWAKTLGLPTIDMAAAAAVAKLWGEDGAQRQLRSFGIDYVASDSNSNDEARHPEAPPRQGAFERLSFSDILSIVSILLGILVPIWQQQDSNQTEARLTGEIRAGFDKQTERLAMLERLLEQALMVKQPEEQGKTTFVARERIARVREEPRNGSKVLAEVFPNQVVTLVREKGKWIQVEYFDWLAQETRSGWVLKKYFLRIRTAADRDGQSNFNSKRS